VKEKQSWGSRLTKWWDKIKSKVSKNQHVEEEVLTGLDINIEGLYEDPGVVIELQKRYMEGMKEIEILKKAYKAHVTWLSILQQLEMSGKKVKQELEKLSQIYSETLLKKGEYRDKIKNEGTAQSNYMEQYEGTMEDILEMMKNHEKNQQAVKQDLAYLEAEKSDLLHQKRRLTTAYRFVRHALITVAFLTSLAALVLAILYFIYERDILLGAMISMVAVIGATVWVYIFRRYLVFELKKNQKLIKRAIELTNKTKIKYINNQKVINYQCKKYHVNSSEMLTLRWENYRDRISAERQYKNISNSIAATMTDIEDLLRKNKIKDDGFIIDYMDYFTSKKGRKILLERINGEKGELKANLKRVEKENHVLNLLLTNYKSR